MTRENRNKGPTLCSVPNRGGLPRPTSGIECARLRRPASPDFGTQEHPTAEVRLARLRGSGALESHSTDKALNSQPTYPFKTSPGQATQTPPHAAVSGVVERMMSPCYALTATVQVGAALVTPVPPSSRRPREDSTIREKNSRMNIEEGWGASHSLHVPRRAAPPPRKWSAHRNT